MVKIKIAGHSELKFSPFAFGNAFTNLNMIEDPTEEDIKEYLPYDNSTIYDCENNPYLVLNKSITEDKNIVVELLTQES